MNKLFYLCVAVAIIFMAAACTDKKNIKSRQDRVEEFRSELTDVDTTVMLRLCDTAMELLKDKQIDQVLSSLYEYNDSTGELKPLSEEVSKRYAKRFKMFPVHDYKLIYYSFMLEGCNDVKYEVTFASPEVVGTNASAKTMYMFNPVKINGEWKLCVKTPQDEYDEIYN